MSTLYDVLGIEKDASYGSVKKGYFSMVRKYPPERYPEKFMKIRNAYEILSNEKTRQEYDSMGGMSNFVRINYEHAKKLMEHGQFGKAISMLEEIGRHFPEMLMVRNLLGEAYSKNGNTEKAVRIYRKLVEDAPDNAGFAGHLAHAYLNRGWQKKAISAFIKAIEQDENNISLWIGLSQAYIENNDRRKAADTLKRSLKHESPENRNSLGPIYFKLAMLDISNRDIQSLKIHLEKMTDIVAEGEEDRENAGWALLNITKELMHGGLYFEAWETIHNAEKLIPDNEEVLKIKKVLKHFLEVEREFARFENDPSYDDKFKAIVFSQLFPEEELNDDLKVSKMIKLMNELEFLNEINIYRKKINSFKDAYLQLYNRMKDFFIQAMNPATNRKMKNQIERELGKNRKFIDSILEQAAFDFDDDDDFEEDDDRFFEPQQPIRREEPKVGRNEPCPCGSGKKHKKCCGK